MKRFNIERKICDIKAPDGYFVKKERLKNQKISHFLEERDIPYDFSALPKKSNFKSQFKLKKDKTKNDFFKKILFWILVAFIIFIFSAIFAYFKVFIPLKDNITQRSISGYQNLSEAIQYSQRLDFKNAGFNFALAYSDFSFVHNLINNYIPNFAIDFLGRFSLFSDQYSKINILRVGENISYSGKLIAEIAEPLLNFSPESLFRFDNELSSSVGAIDFSEAFMKIKEVKKSVDEASYYLNYVNTYDFPEEYREKIWLLKNNFQKAKFFLDDFYQYAYFANWFLGVDNPKTFLVLFQNTAEKRATGGFIGSYGIIKTEFGYVKEIKVDDVYNVDGQLFYRVKPPFPIQKISTAWSLHDSNWFFDFPTSAKKAAFFYEKAGGETIDGVIAVNEKILEEILKLVGPIKLEEYNVVISDSNFFDFLEGYIDESFKLGDTQPKKILSVLTEEIFKRLNSLKKDNLKDLFEILKNGLKDKDIMLWTNQKDFENFFIKKGFAGNVWQTPQKTDYFALVVSNINGFKTDKVIAQDVFKEIKIEKNGEIRSLIEITRKHTAKDNDPEWYKKVNSVFLRIYLPKGSEVLSVSGFTKEKTKEPIDYKKAEFYEDKEVQSSINNYVYDVKTGLYKFEESDKLVLGGWVYTSPQKQTKIKIEYKLPFVLDTSKKADDFNIYIQKQSGDKSNFKLSISLPDGFSYAYLKPDDFVGEYIGALKDLVVFVGVNF